VLLQQVQLMQATVHLLLLHPQVTLLRVQAMQQQVKPTQLTLLLLPQLVPQKLLQ
jgi:hypothetical protein